MNISLKKFLVDSKMFEYDKHFRECKKQNRPFIKARKNPKYNAYLVQGDLATCNYNLTKMDENNLDQLFKNESNFFTSDQSKKSKIQDYNIDKEYVWFDGVLPERLNNFCENLFDLSAKN